MVTSSVEAPISSFCTNILKLLDYNFEMNSALYISNIATCILNSVFAILAVAGNVVVITAILKTPSFRGPSNILLCSVALSDLLTGVIVQPGYVFMKVAALNLHWDLVCIGIFVKIVVGFLMAGNSFVSLTAMTADKWLTLHFHLKYQELFTVKRVLVLIIIFWFSCVGIVGLLVSGEKRLFQIIVVAVGAMRFLANALSFCSIFKTVKRHENQINIQLQAAQHLQNSDNTSDVRKLGKSSKTVFVLYTLFLLCFVPSLVIVCFQSVLNMTTSLKIATDICFTLSFMNASLNPTFYIWKMKEIRQTARNVFMVSCI